MQNDSQGTHMGKDIFPTLMVVKIFLPSSMTCPPSMYPLHHIVRMLPGSNLGTVLVTPDDFMAPEIPQIVDKKMVGDTGFEPVTSTVCKRNKKTKKRKT
jgi:hypothetical protein